MPIKHYVLFTIGAKGKIERNAFRFAVQFSFAFILSSFVVISMQRLEIVFTALAFQFGGNQVDIGSQKVAYGDDCVVHIRMEMIVLHVLHTFINCYLSAAIRFYCLYFDQRNNREKEN